MSRGPLFLSDTSINIDPNAKDLAKIAQMTSYTAKLFGIEPKVALLSYSNFGSSKNEDAQKVSQAVRLVHRYLPDIAVDGPIQADFALNKVMLTNKFPFSKIAGKEVNTLVLPDLNAANIAYKLIKELDDALSIGPIMMGLKQAVHILQLGASVDEIVHMTAVASSIGFSAVKKECQFCISISCSCTEIESVIFPLSSYIDISPYFHWHATF
jgi:malate dehydrogenase (oxaloacetate-decarboxylating)(NADP+)